MTRILGVRRDQPISALEIQEKHPAAFAEAAREIYRNVLKEDERAVEPETVRARPSKGGTPENPVV